MKSLIMLLTIFAFTVGVLAQTTEKFDIITFQTPKGWQKDVKENSVQIGAENSNGGVCLITIFKSVSATGDSKANFNAAWESVVKGVVNVKSAPQMNPAGNKNGWVIESGLAQYEADGKQGGVILITAAGNGKMIAFMVLTNTDSFEKEIDFFIESVKLPKIESKTGTNSTTGIQSSQKSPTISAKNDGYTYTTQTFDDGWVSVVQNDWVLVTKGQIEVYICYALPFNGSDFTGTGVRERDYYWDNYVGKYFAIQSKQYQDNGVATGGLQPDYVEGWATNRQTGQKRFLAMTLSNNPNTAYVTIASAPNEATFRQQFPKANDKYSSDLSSMRGYNKFAVTANDIVGNWTHGENTGLMWYYVTPSGNANFAGTTIASVSASFNFGNGGLYTSEHRGTTGSLYNLNSHKQNYKGNYQVTNWNLSATNRWQGKTDTFEAWFEVIRGGRILHLKDGSTTYNLVKTK